MSKKKIHDMHYIAKTQGDADGSFRGILACKYSTGKNVTEKFKPGFKDRATAQAWANAEKAEAIRRFKKAGIKKEQEAKQTKQESDLLIKSNFKELAETINSAKVASLRKAAESMFATRAGRLWEEYVFSAVMHDHREEVAVQAEANNLIGTTTSKQLNFARLNKLDQLAKQLEDAHNFRLATLLCCSSKTTYIGSEAATSVLSFIEQIPDIRSIEMFFKTLETMEFSASETGKVLNRNVFLYYLDKAFEVGAQVLIKQSKEQNLANPTLFGLRLSRFGLELQSSAWLQKYCETHLINLAPSPGYGNISNYLQPTS